MGANASSIDASAGQVPVDLDVLQHGRPLHVLLSSLGSIPPSSESTEDQSELKESANGSASPRVLTVDAIAANDRDAAGPSKNVQDFSDGAKYECNGDSLPNGCTEAEDTTPNTVRMDGLPAVPSAAKAHSHPDLHPRPLPADPDHDYWGALFCDFVVFDLAARAPHRSALRALCHEAGKSFEPFGSPESPAFSPPRSRAAAAIALALRAAIPRVRDYAEESAGSYIASSASLSSADARSPTSSTQAKEVLGALLLSTRVLATLSESCDVGTMCLVLAADGPHDALATRDRADIGYSALWQLLTCALDCVSRPHVHDPVAPNIALAAINLILVAMATQHLAPFPSAELVGGGQAKPVGSDASSCNAVGEDMQESPGNRPGRQLCSELLTSIVDRYSRPGDLLASLLDLACDAAPHRGTSHSTDTSAKASSSKGTPRAPRSRFAERSASESSSVGDGTGLVSSVSRRISSALLPRSVNPMGDVPSPGSLQALPTPLSSSSSAAAVLSVFSSRLPSPTSSVFSPSMLWSASPSSDDGSSIRSGAVPAPPPTPSLSQMHVHENLVGNTTPTEGSNLSGAGKSETPKTPARQLGARAAAVDAPPHVIARAPTLLGEQALALVAVLCSPRGSEGGVKARPGSFESAGGSDSNGTEGSFELTPAETQVPRPGSNRNTAQARQGSAPTALSNPYRSALFGLHDLPQRDSVDDFTYSFSRLYETLGAWVEDARGALVVYMLVVGNRRFRTFVLARTDPDVLFVPLMAAIHTRTSSPSPSAPADMYIPANVALLLSSDAGFCAAIDEIVIPSNSLGWFDDRVRLSSSGISLSGLVFLVCIRCVQHSVMSKRRVMESYLASTCASIMANVGAAMTGMSNLAADRLVALTNFVGKRRKKAAIIAEHAKDMPLSPPPVRNGLESRFRVSHALCPLRSNAPSLGSPCVPSNSGGKDPHSPDGLEAIGGVSSGQGLSKPSTTGRSMRSRDPGKDDVVFSICGVEVSEAECGESLAELLGTLLETITSVLRSRSSVSVNRHLMYALLHRESVFSQDYIENATSRSRVLVGRIRKAIAFFSQYLDDSQGGGIVTGGDFGGMKQVAPVNDRTVLSLSVAGISDTYPTVQSGGPSSGPGLSVDRVFDVIDRYGRMLPREIWFSLPEARYAYCESQWPGNFFVPYAWVLAMRDSSLHWDPAQFPDARIPLAHSVFHPPRPSHGTARI